MQSMSWAVKAPGDILIFMSGEREIRDTADALIKQKFATHRSATAVCPLIKQ